MITSTTQRRSILIGGLAIAALSFTACGGSDEAAGDLEAFCNKFEEIDNQEEFDEAAISAQLGELAGLAPAEISDDLNVMSDAFDTLTDLTDRLASGEEITEENAELVQATEAIDSASTRVEEYVTEECGLELGS